MFDIDLELTEEGDFALNDEGDLSLVTEYDCMKQTAYNVLKSVSIDWYIDNIGADLEQLFGIPIKIAEAKGRELIITAFNKYELFRESTTHISTKLLNNHKIMFIIIIPINFDEDIIALEVELDLTGKININWGDIQ